MNHQYSDDSDFGQFDDSSEDSSHEQHTNIFNLSEEEERDLENVLQSLTEIPVPRIIHQNGRRSRKEIYGNGPEHQKLLRMPHNDEEFKNKDFFKRLGCPKKDWINEVGSKYNEYFKKEIALKKYPKFSRGHNRSKRLGYFFLEDNQDIIIPFLKAIEKIPPDF